MDEIRTQNYGPEEIKEEDARRFMMAWEAEQKGYTAMIAILQWGIAMICVSAVKTKPGCVTGLN